MIYNKILQVLSSFKKGSLDCVFYSDKEALRFECYTHDLPYKVNNNTFELSSSVEILVDSGKSSNKVFFKLMHDFEFNLCYEIPVFTNEYLDGDIASSIDGFWYLDEDIASRIEWANQYKVQPFEKLEEEQWRHLV